MSRTCPLVLALCILGCGPEATPAPQPAAAPEEAAPERAPEAPRHEAPRVEAPKVEPADAPVPDGPIGVAACDDYVTAYRACIDTLAIDDRASHTKVVEGQRAAWHRARADAKTAAGLPDACAAARTAAKAAMPACKQW
jgi:hypothetical protein